MKLYKSYHVLYNKLSCLSIIIVVMQENDPVIFKYLKVSQFYLRAGLTGVNLIILLFFDDIIILFGLKHFYKSLQ